MEINKIYNGEALDVLKTFADESIDCVVTSPPYWGLRDYGVDKQLGLEETFTEYIEKLCNIFDEIKRVLKKQGTCFVNLGDTYGGSGNGNWDAPIEIRGKQYRKTCNIDQEYLGPPRKTKNFSKSLLQIPSRFAIEMVNRGWTLRNELIWWKPNSMPCSARDRFTVDFEKVFFFVKSKKYYFELQKEKIKNSTLKRCRYGVESKKTEQGLAGGMDIKKQLKYFSKIKNGEVTGRNKRCVWKIATQPFHGAHFAVYPPKLIETPIKAGCIFQGIVLDPFFGSGTTGLVALKLNRNFIGIELNPEYIEIAQKRIDAELEKKSLELFAS